MVDDIRVQIYSYLLLYYLKYKSHLLFPEYFPDLPSLFLPFIAQAAQYENSDDSALGSEILSRSKVISSDETDAVNGTFKDVTEVEAEEVHELASVTVTT